MVRVEEPVPEKGHELQGRFCQKTRDPEKLGLGRGCPRQELVPRRLDRLDRAHDGPRAPKARQRAHRELDARERLFGGSVRGRTYGCAPMDADPRSVIRGAA